MGGDCESGVGLPAKARLPATSKSNNRIDIRRHVMHHPESPFLALIIVPFTKPKIRQIPNGKSFYNYVVNRSPSRATCSGRTRPPFSPIAVATRLAEPLS